MADKPILFSPTMVRALLAGSKTQTRRLLTPQPPDDFVSATFIESFNREGEVNLSMNLCPASLAFSPFHNQLRRLHRPGDRLYVREAWQSDTNANHLPPRDIPARSPVWYPADDGNQFATEWSVRSTAKTRQAMHMPKWASRLTLIVTATRVQRLQEISETDAKAEGGKIPTFAKTIPPQPPATYRDGYKILWDSLNADRAPWSTNPWVVAYTFEVKHGNIAEMKGATT